MISWVHLCHFIRNVLEHLYGKEVTHLLVSWEDILQESYVAYHIFKCAAIFIRAHDNRHASLILANKLNATVLDLVIINDEGSNLN